MSARLRAIFSKSARNMASAAAEPAAAEGPSRRMRWPYTFSAQLAQFPYKFYYENSPLIPYLALAFVFSQPLFWFFHKMARSPENIKKWDEIHEHARHHPKPWEQD